MARNYFSLATPAEVALVAATAKTVLQVIASANVVVAIQEIMVTFDGVSNTAEPAMIEVKRQTTAGTATSTTPLKTKDRSTALSTTGSRNASAEPTAGDLLAIFHVHPQAGVIHSLSLPDGEIEMAGGTRLGVVITAPANVNCLCTIKGEE